jgi:hypothetical protein
MSDKRDGSAENVMKLHRHREHHYLKKLTRLQAAGGLPVGVGVHQIDKYPKRDTLTRRTDVRP